MHRRSRPSSAAKPSRRAGVTALHAAGLCLRRTLSLGKFELNTGVSEFSERPKCNAPLRGCQVRLIAGKVRHSRLRGAAPAAYEKPPRDEHRNPVAKYARARPERPGLDDGKEQQPHPGKLQAAADVVQKHVVRPSDS